MVDWEAFYKWLEGKVTFQAFIVGATLFLMGIAKIMMSSQSSQQSQQAQPKYRGGQYLYPTLPERCYCHSCGYVWENPPDHCRNLTCPKCGSKNMWRKPP